MIAAFRALSQRNFYLYVLGQVISLIGAWIQQVTVSWITYRVTGSPFMLGLIAFAGQAPLLLLAPWGGSLADRFERRHILIVTQWIEMGVALSLGGVALFYHFNVGILLAAALTLGVAGAVEMPTRQAFLPELLSDKSLMGNAIALNSTTFNGARLIGPAIAAVLLSFTGDAACFFTNALSYVAALYTLFRIHPIPKPLHQRTIQEEGEWMWLRRFTPARWLLLSVAITSFCLSPFMTFMPLYARDVFHGGPLTLGWLMGCSGAGALIITLLLASRRSPQGLDRLAWLGLGTAALVTLAFSYNHSLALALPLLFLSGGSFIAIVTSCNIMLQSVVPDRLRGRVMALYSMSFLGMMPLGSLLNGVLARNLGTPNTFLLSGCIALILVTTLYFRRHTLQAELAYGINHPEGSELLQNTLKI